MPIKYIGRTTDFKGKSLWEILGNLKNFGVGRMVVRNKFQRYPDPCYMKILKVAAMPLPKNPNEDRKVMVLVERTFRGITNPKPVQIDSTSYKTDYILIPKDEEDRFLSQQAAKPITILPKTMDFPPLFKELLIRKAKVAKKPLTEEPKLPIKYNLKKFAQYKIAEEGETATQEFSIGLGTPASPSLYANIQKDPAT